MHVATMIPCYSPYAEETSVLGCPSGVGFRGKRSFVRGNVTEHFPPTLPESHGEDYLAQPPRVDLDRAGSGQTVAQLVGLPPTSRRCTHGQLTARGPILTKGPRRSPTSGSENSGSPGCQDRCVQNIDSFTTISALNIALRNRRTAGPSLAGTERRMPLSSPHP